LPALQRGAAEATDQYHGLTGRVDAAAAVNVNRRRVLTITSLLAIALGFATQHPGAQTYSRGQNASPAFEGWEQNADGTFNFLFGYMNRNWDEVLSVPIGPDNNIEPGGPDRGQPTVFLPRRNRFVFRVQVPKEWGDKELIWTLTTKGKTEKAFASLRTDYFIDDVVIASETGALGAGTSSPEVRANKRPSVKIEGIPTRNARVGQPLTVVAWVADDGVPRPRGNVGSAVRRPSTNASPTLPRNPAYTPPSRLTVGKRVGLHLSWFVYRAPGISAEVPEPAVRFEPAQVKVWEDTRTGANSPWAPLWTPPPVPGDGRYEVTVVFQEPGTYTLRARADDGALFGDQDLMVTVTR
jgi:hypothetical protein